MKKKFIILIVISLIVVVGFVMPNNGWTSDTPVAKILFSLGMDKPTHFIDSIDVNKARMGKELVETGHATKPNGLKSSYISKYFVCTDCHNQEREDPVLIESNPDKRLDYVTAKNIPFLQGTTFWGMVNRETWYNGDYVLKYGSLVDKAKNDLAESTQLCAKECSSGRYLSDWELEAIMHYFWTLELKLSDLELSDKEMRRLNVLSRSENDRKSMIDELSGKFMTYSPATFPELPKNLKEGFPERATANPERGKMIFESSCLHCHSAHGPSQLILDDDKFTFRKFKNHMDKYDDFGLYHITRKGTYAEHGHQQYMPRYPKERMSNQQLEDLRAYIEGSLKKR